MDSSKEPMVNPNDIRQGYVVGGRNRVLSRQSTGVVDGAAFHTVLLGSMQNGELPLLQDAFAANTHLNSVLTTFHEILNMRQDATPALITGKVQAWVLPKPMVVDPDVCVNTIFVGRFRIDNGCRGAVVVQSSRATGLSAFVLTHGALDKCMMLISLTNYQDMMRRVLSAAWEKHNTLQIQGAIKLKQIITKAVIHGPQKSFRARLKRKLDNVQWGRLVGTYR
jgi:hypothetical protein